MATESFVPDIEAAPLITQSEYPSQEQIRAAVDRAGRRIAPLWPLQHFVAVNPYLGLLEQSFESAAQTLGRRAGAAMTASRAFYAEMISNGRITESDLEAALSESRLLPGVATDLATLKAVALSNVPEISFKTMPNVADVAKEITGKNWPHLVTESISRWAATHFDQGQSYWKSPWANLSPYAAWRAEALIDRTPEVSGLRGFRKILADLPESAEDTIEVALKLLNIPIDGLDAYLHCLLLTINGWASHARYQLWEAELYGGEDHTLTDLLAIRLAWEVALMKVFAQNGLLEAWQVRKHELACAELDGETQGMLACNLLLQSAFEKAYQRQLISQLSTPKQTKARVRKQVQAAFCIDVRSEVFRRALETVSDSIETIGFAGFFGFPIEYVRLGDTYGDAQCPALLAPKFIVTESVTDISESEITAIAEKRRMRQHLTKAWRMFKFGAVSCFGFVGPVGLAYLKNLIMDTLGWGRPVPMPAAFGLDKDTYKRLAPAIELHAVGDRIGGITLAQQIEVAEGALRAMSLTDNFARVVLLAGHGATTVNNPYATALDCGACGGHTGEANARVAVQVLNNPAVRLGLNQHGIVIPEDTLFVAGLHDTTTDHMAIFDRGVIPASHAADLVSVENQLAAAGQLARAERGSLFKIGRDKQVRNVDKSIIRRSTDWSQVRPEWGLAGCAAFIIAPRERTRGFDLAGRSFLHSYDWHQDEDFSVLALIMTAPMIVASWINLQYYASTVDNRFFGSGNKALHNVVGILGVLEGNGGDLRVGLPWQSVHDGEKYVHEPLRLTVLIEAPVEAINSVIAQNESVRQLVDNGWLYLFALDNSGKVAHQYTRNLTWMAV